MSLVKKIKNKFLSLFENKILTIPFRFFKLKDVILFESHPDFADNTKAVFDCMVENGLNEKYKMVWLVKTPPALPIDIKNVSFFVVKSIPFKKRLALNRLKFTAKYSVSCNSFLVSHRRKQRSFYLSHGTPIKVVKGYYNAPKNINYFLTASVDQRIVDLAVDQFGVDRKKIFSLGFPRNDVFKEPPSNLRPLFNTFYKKIIVWYPTYRQHNAGGKIATQNALPIVGNPGNAKTINDYAKMRDVLIVIKPHFAQDLSLIKSMDLENIVLINDDFYIKNNLTSYKFISSCDALISDYSSVYFDYLLCNKPSAVVWEDYEEYKNNVGFAIDMDFYMKGAEKIYTVDDFKTFIDNVACERDSLQEERAEICNIVNYSSDGKNAQRVTDFIISKI